MQLLCLAAALRLAAEPPCEGELQRVLQDAQKPGQVGGDVYAADGTADRYLRHARETSFLFNNLPERCAAAFRDWQQTQLPEQCVAPYRAFLKQGATPLPSVAFPQWDPPKQAAQPRILYLVSAADPKSVPVLLRTFARLDRPEDKWVYLVDQHKSPGLIAELRAKLPHPNVEIRPAQRHAMLYFFPRVESVLTALGSLLEEDPSWTHVYHLSESDYPLHGRPPPLDGSRHAPPRQDAVFTDSIPRAGDDWYWWDDRTGVFDCEGFAVPDRGVQFPAAADLERAGLKLHRGGEWFGFPRSFAEYLRAPASAAAVANYTTVMRHRWSSDEVFWATLARSVPGLESKLPVKPGWFVLWDMQQGHSPDVFEGQALARHEQEILDSDRLFVRKVALPGSEELLRLLG